MILAIAIAAVTVLGVTYVAVKAHRKHEGALAVLSACASNIAHRVGELEAKLGGPKP